jgi:hypothetical protein
MSEDQAATTVAVAPEDFPEHLRTRFTEVSLRCPKCTSEWQPAVAVVVNVKTDPKAREGILRHTMHKSRCPACKRHEYEIDQIFEYYDPDDGLLVQIRPKWEFKAGGGEEVYWKRLEALILKHVDDDVRVDVAFGFDDFIEKHLGGKPAEDAAMARRQREIDDRVEAGTYHRDDLVPPREESTATA